MSYIPDCRTDENYNQKYLNKSDKDFIDGYDCAVEQIVNLIKYNSDVYPELARLLDEKLGMVNTDKVKIVVEAIEHWAEMERDEIITAFIGSMDEEEYKSIKEKIDGQSEKAD